MSQRPNRRSILKSIGISGVGLTQVVPVSGTSASRGVIVHDYRGADNPLANGEISQLQKQVAREHRTVEGTSSPVPVSGPIVTEKGPKIASYAIKVFPDGTSRYHASAVGDDPSRSELRDAHNATEVFVNDVKDRRTLRNSARDEVK